MLARHDVKTAYVGSMCCALVARRGETDIAGVYVFTKRLATRRVAGPVAEAEGGVAVGLFERGRVPIAQRGNPREDVEDLLSAARFNRSNCTVTRALLDLMLEKTPLRLSRGACLDQMVRPRCQHRTAAAAAATAASLLFFLALYRHLGGADGDVFGALLEVSRAAYLYGLGRVAFIQS